MRFVSRSLSVLLIVVLAVPALAQDAAETAPQGPQGLGLGAIIVGMGVLAVVGILMSRREANGDSDDLV